MCGIKCRHRLAVALVGLCTLLLLYCCSGQASAAAITGEATYMITQSELNQLSSNLTRLQTINSELLKNSRKQSKQIATLQSRLATAEQQSRDLKTRLLQAESDSLRASNSLTKANQSLMQYAAEEKRTRLRIKAQRNTWEAIAAGLLVAWAAK